MRRCGGKVGFVVMSIHWSEALLIVLIFPLFPCVNDSDLGSSSFTEAGGCHNKGRRQGRRYLLETSKQSEFSQGLIILPPTTRPHFTMEYT